MIVTRWQASLLPNAEQVFTILQAEGYDPIEEVYEPNTVIRDHRHPFDEVRMVVSGQMLLNIAGNQLLLRPGDRIEIPSNTRHSKQVQGEEPCRCVVANRV